jgi:hypothetical protein
MQTNHGTFHLADNPKMYQPVRTNNFRFIVHDLDRLLRLGGDPNNDDDYITNAQEIIDFSVVSFVEPDFSQDPITINRGNSTIYFAGKASYSTGDLVINDFTGADGKSVLRAWQALSYNPIDDTIQSSENYKVDATVLEYTPDNKLLNYWELKGCWVSSISTTGYDNNNPGAKTVTARIVFDRAIPHKAD